MFNPGTKQETNGALLLFAAVSGFWQLTAVRTHYGRRDARDARRNRTALESAYPILRGAAEFFLDYLVEDPATGWLISGPSCSPEQTRVGLCMGPAMDHQIVRQLFADVIAAAHVLQIDAEFVAQLKSVRARIAPDRIGQFGQLQEWLADLDRPADKHRHISHLYALYPGEEITPAKTPELAQAAKVALEQRSDPGRGCWTASERINCSRCNSHNKRSPICSTIIHRSKSTGTSAFPPP